MALVFHRSPEEPVECALEISRTLKAHPELPLRMGVHSGPVTAVVDVNDTTSVAGAGINMAQRVMDCGDAGHILLSKHVAEDLEHYGHWQPHLHDLGECEVKHGVSVHIVNLYTEELGNSEPPEKFKHLRGKKKTTAAISGPSARPSGLKWVMISAVVVIAVAFAVGILTFTHRPSPKSVTRSAPTSPVSTEAATSEKSIAVLPFENLSDDKANAYFADGIQDELLASLSKVKELKVISRTSVMQYKAGITRTLKEIAQKLGVNHVVEGSVRRSGGHVRVSVQLIDAQTDRHIWVQNYDRTLADSLTLQGELATEIAAAVGATLSPQEKAQVTAKPTNNVAAYDAYLHGRVFASEENDLEKALNSYRKAVELDPNFALAWTRLSSMQSQAYWQVDSSPARLTVAKTAVNRALALDPSLPEVHLALAYYRYYVERDFTGALAELRQAEQALPNDTDVVKTIAFIQRRQGQWDKALAGLRRTVELDPRDIEGYSNLALTYEALRRFPEALATFDRASTWEPANFDCNCAWKSLGRMRADALLSMGSFQDFSSPGHGSVYSVAFIRAGQALLQARYADAKDILSKALADNRCQETRTAQY
jgi:TolB-like protein